MNEQQYAQRVQAERNRGLVQVMFMGMVAHDALGLNYFTGEPHPRTEPTPATPIFDALAGAR
jgi:hypothetical protein